MADGVPVLISVPHDRALGADIHQQLLSVDHARADETDGLGTADKLNAPVDLLSARVVCPARVYVIVRTALSQTVPAYVASNYPVLRADIASVDALAEVVRTLLAVMCLVLNSRFVIAATRSRVCRRYAAAKAVFIGKRSGGSRKAHCRSAARKTNYYGTFLTLWLFFELANSLSS